MDAVHRRIARNIRARAKVKNILITHLPDRAGVGRSSFFNVMSGESSPTVRWLVKIAQALDCDMADLTVRDDRQRKFAPAKQQPDARSRGKKAEASD